MMERLREKGYLAGKKVGNMMFYTPQVPRRRIVRGAMRSFAEKVLDGTIGSLVSYLIKEENLSPAEIEEIKALLEEKGGPEDEKSEK
jgi:BlaI family penicillinase repressor